MNYRTGRQLRSDYPNPYYRQERRWNPIATVVVIAFLAFLAWQLYRMGAAPSISDFPARTRALSMGVESTYRHGAGDGWIYQPPVSPCWHEASIGGRDILTQATAN